MSFVNGCIHILFTDLIQVYADGAPLALVKEMSIATGNTESPSMTIQNDLLVYCIKEICKVLNITDGYAQTLEIQLEKLVTDVAISYPYLIIAH